MNEPEEVRPVPPPPTVPGPVDDDAILDYTHAKRTDIVNALAPNGVVPIADPKQLGALLQTLDGMDRTALGRKRLKVEEGGNALQEQASKVIAELLTRMSGASSSSKWGEDPGGTKGLPPLPVLPASIPPPVMVAGETTIGSIQGSYENFTTPQNAR